MKINKTLLILCLVVPLAVGGLSALLTGSSMEMFETIEKPPLSPPGWLFPIAWTILYTLMGIASYLVLTSGASEREKRITLILYGIQLAFNFLWPLFFFNLKAYLFSFLWLILLWLLILATIYLFCRLTKKSALLLLPYLIWVAFAGYLNLGVYLLN